MLLKIPGPLIVSAPTSSRNFVSGKDILGNVDFDRAEAGGSRETQLQRCRINTYGLRSRSSGVVEISHDVAKGGGVRYNLQKVWRRHGIGGAHESLGGFVCKVQDMNVTAGKDSLVFEGELEDGIRGFVGESDGPILGMRAPEQKHAIAQRHDVQ